MRYNLLRADGLEIGYITDTPEFRWELNEFYEGRLQLERFIKKSRHYEMVVTGGEMDEHNVTPPEEDVPIDDTGRVVRLATELPNEFPIQVEKADEMDKDDISQELTNLVDKKRRYVESPSDAPDDVQVEEGPQGGYYYETDTGSTESGYDQSARPFDGEIDDSFSGVQQKIINNSVSEAEEKLDLSSLEEITTEVPISGFSGEAGGQAFFNPDTIWINPDKFGMSADFDEYTISGRHFDLASEQSRSVIFHELIHIAHAQVKREHGVKSLDWDDKDDTEVIGDEVSLYAATTPDEMVAEVGALLLSGEDVSEPVREMYRKYGGPEL